MISLLLIGIAVSIYYFKAGKVIIPHAQKEKSAITLEQIAIDIHSNNITTVEALADFYETNPVQLNRLFKTFDTTPGKFLKKVKLKLAKEMLQNGATMEEVVLQTGYSAHYIKEHLNK
jgi:AraC-like DNA-binding protein